MRTRALLLILCAGCEGVIAGEVPVASFDETEPRSIDPTELDENGLPYVPGPRAVPKLPSAAVCQAAPSGRGYRGLAGESLEAGRADVAPLVDNHRTLRNVAENSNTWTAMMEIVRSLGLGTSQMDAELKDPGVGAAFGVTPKSWYDESEVGAFAVYVTFQYAFKVCRRAFDLSGPGTAPLRVGWYEHTAFEPTVERATAFCQRTQRAAWLKEPTPAEVEACVSLARTLPEPDVKTRWAYVCASVFASPNFLAN